MSEQLELSKQVEIIEKELASSQGATNLTTDTKYYKGIPFYAKSYNGTTTYYAILNSDAKRIGINAFDIRGTERYVFPILADLETFKTTLPFLRQCAFVSAFASDSSEKDKIVQSLHNLSTPLGFQGQIKIHQNRPGKKLSTSFYISLGKNESKIVDLDKAVDFTSKLTEIDWTK